MSVYTAVADLHRGPDAGVDQLKQDLPRQPHRDLQVLEDPLLGPRRSGALEVLDVEVGTVKR